MLNPRSNMEEVREIFDEFIDFYLRESEGDIEGDVQRFLDKESDKREFAFLFRKFGHEQLEEWLIICKTENEKDRVY